MAFQLAGAATGTIALLIGLYMASCWFILSIMITPERRQFESTLIDHEFPNVRRLSFKSKTDGVLLRGWLVPAEGARAVILTHGIHSHAWGCHAPDLVRAYRHAGFDVFLFDLRGHGGSEGDFLGLGLLERGDVQAAVELLMDEGFDPGHIGIHGTSYGAGTAVLAAADIGEIGAVIADSAFSNIRDVISGEIERRTGLSAHLAELFIPGLRFLTRVIYKLDVNEAAPERAIAQVAPRPILLIHGTEDSVIPYEHGQRLKTAAGDAAELWTLEGAGHTQGVRLIPDCATLAPTGIEFLRRTTEFFRRHLGRGATSSPATAL